MTQKDLTRWNRAGLSRFTYVDGNSADYLERLRANLAEQFPSPSWKRLHEVPNAEDENDQQRLQRIEEQYASLRRDWGWELGRSLARASHILCGHIDAYANESYLRTATQWDNLRKMVEMLDYHPAPPASAATPVALELKEGMAGTVDKGLPFKYAPPQGGDALIFETLEALEADAGLNLLHLRGWNRSTTPFDPYAQDGDSLWRYSEVPEVSVGDIAVLMHDPQQYGSGAAALGIERWAVATRIIQVGETALSIGPQPLDEASLAQTWIKGATRLDYAAKDIFVAHLNGADVVRFAQPHGLAPEQVLAWQTQGQWQFNVIAEAEELRIRVAEPERMPTLLVYAALRIQPVPDASATTLEFRVPLDTAAAVYRNASGALVSLEMDPASANCAFEIAYDDETGAIPMYKWLTQHIDAMEIYIARPNMPLKSGLPLVGQALPQDEGIYSFDGSPGDLASGQTVVGEGLDGDRQPIMQALEIIRITELEKSFELHLRAAGAIQGEGTLAGRGPVDLKKLLRRAEQCLDESAFNQITLDELLSGAIADRSVVDIQGIGPLTGAGSSYTDRLAAAGITTIAELAAAEVAEMSGFTPVKLREMKAKAEILMDAKMAVGGVAELLPLTLAQVIGLQGEAALQAGIGGGLAVGLVFSSLKRIYGPFEESLTPQGYDVNTNSATDAADWLELEVDVLPEPLVRGRKLLVEQSLASGFAYPHRAEVAAIEGAKIQLQPPLPSGAGYTLGNTVVYGNVVTAGHGESHGEKVLGSGDATQSAQVFVFKVAGVSFVADATQSTGVRADIVVNVDGRDWRQVSSLKDSKPFDHDYTVHMTEDGFLQISFGDGRHGRRLPSGSNNIRIAFRKGSGLQGIIPAEAFSKPSKPHALVKAARQPFAATGGNDMEDAASLRENAPATVLTLERAVSLADFSRLATAHSSVWQAQAVSRQGGYRRKQLIEVVVVPANGGQLGGLKDTLETYLQEHTMPDVSLEVKEYTEVNYGLRIGAHVDEAAYNIEQVIPKVEAAVTERFSLRHRRLGASVYLSEVYKIVEAVEGVEYSEVDFLLQDSSGQYVISESKVLKAEDFRSDIETHQKILVLSHVVVNPISPDQGEIAIVKAKRI